MAVQPKSVPYCRHIIADGHVCQSPAIRGTLFCYYHARDRQRVRILRRRAQTKKSADADVKVLAALNLPTPDNPVATQVCIAAILQAMMTGVISGPLGGRLLYGLHMAKCNYREVESFQQRFLDTDLPLRVVSIAATDPEPIADPEAPPEEVAVEQKELKHYGKSLQVERFERPSIDGEVTEAECGSDKEFMQILDRVAANESEKEHCARDLHSAEPGERRYARESIFQLVHRMLDQLEKKRAQPDNAQAG